MATTKIQLTDDTLKNILLMAPMLDEMGQCKVFGLMCGLIAGTSASNIQDLVGIREESAAS
ncbi:MAG: hypothetical protein Q4F24_07920 [Eubacteriales bacterium]|nr:hypothetical protein [Eubacteriales bacterium]